MTVRVSQQVGWHTLKRNFFERLFLLIFFLPLRKITFGDVLILIISGTPWKEKRFSHSLSTKFSLKALLNSDAHLLTHVKDLEKVKC